VERAVAKVRKWYYTRYTSGTSTVVDGIVSDPWTPFLGAGTLLRTRAFCTVSAFAQYYPLQPNVAHSQLLLQVGVFPGDAMDAGWPDGLVDFPYQVLEAPFQVTASTVTPAGFTTASAAAVALDMAPQPGTTDSHAMRKYPADAGPVGYWSISGAGDSASGLSMSVRLKIGCLFELDE
jgi:hypothetical protein